MEIAYFSMFQQNFKLDPSGLEVVVSMHMRAELSLGRGWTETSLFNPFLKYHVVNFNTKLSGQTFSDCKLTR